MAANLDIIIRAQNLAGNVLNGLQSDLKSIGQQAQRVGTTLSVGVTAPFALFAKTGIQTVSEFSRTMAELEVVTGASGDTLQTLTDTAIELGAVTSFSANEAASAMLELSKAGMDTESVLASIPGVLSLAAAGGVDLAYAANLTASSLNAFQLEADQAGYVSNLLAAAANESSASIGDLAQGLQQGGFAFNAAGQNIDDLAASLAILTNVGLTGSDAGTALKNAMTRLMSPTDQAAKLMKELGINTYDAQGNMLPMTNIIGVFDEALAGMTQQQRNAALETIFMSDGMKAMIPLLEQGSEGFDEMKEAVNQAGAAQRVADAKMRGLAGAFEYASGSIESALLNIWMPFEETLSDIIRQGADFVTWLSQLPKPAINAAIAFAGVLAVMGPILAALPMIGAAIAALMTPIGLIVLAIGGLAAVWASDWGGIQEKTKTVLDTIGDLFSTLWTSLSTGDFQPLWDKLASVWNSIKTWAVDVYNSLVEKAGTWASALSAWASETWTNLSPKLLSLWTSITSWIAVKAVDLPGKFETWRTEFTAWAVDLWNDATLKLAIYKNKIESWITFQGAILGLKMQRWVPKFTEWATGIWTDLSTNLATMWTSFSGWIDGKVDVLYAHVYKWATEFWSWTGEVWTNLSPKLNELIAKLQNWIIMQGLVLKTKFDTWADGVDGLSEGMDTAFTAMQAAWDLIAPIIENNLQRISDALTAAKDDIAPLGEAFRNLWTTVQPVITALALGIMITLGVAFNAILILATSVFPEIGNIVVAAVDTISAAIELLKTVVTEGFALVSSLVQGDWAGAWTAAQNIFAAFRTFITTNFSSLLVVVTSLIAIIRNIVVAVLDDMGMNGASVVRQMASSIRLTFLQMKINLDTAVTAIKTLVVIVFEQIKSRISGAIEAARVAIVGTFNQMATDAGTAIETLKTAVTTKFTAIKTWIEGLTIANPFSAVVGWANSAKTAVQDAWNFINGRSGGGGGSGSGPGNAERTTGSAGSGFFPGGMAMLNERGPELIMLPGRNRQAFLPRGSRVITAEQTAGMIGGGPIINIYATVANELDIEQLALRVASALRRNQR